VTVKKELKEALSYHCSIAGERLRVEGLAAGGLSIYLATSWHIEDSFQTGATINFGRPTDDTLDFIRAANQVLEQCFRSGPQYMKAGVLLLDLATKGQRENLFEPPQDSAPGTEWRPWMKSTPNMDGAWPVSPPKGSLMLHGT
jgi:DNA polymerase V